MYWLVCGWEKLGGQEEKLHPPFAAHQVVQTSSIILVIWSELKSTISQTFFLASKSSSRSLILQHSGWGTEKYFNFSLTALGVRSDISSTPHSFLMFSRVLPNRVLWSSLAKLAKYLILDFLLEERESANFTYLLDRRVFGWAQPDTLSMKYRWVVHGKLTFLTVDLESINPRGSYHRSLFHR